MAEYVCKNGVLRPINHIYQAIPDKLEEGIHYAIDNGYNHGEVYVAEEIDGLYDCEISWKSKIDVLNYYFTSAKGYPEESRFAIFRNINPPYLDFYYSSKASYGTRFSNISVSFGQSDNIFVMTKKTLDINGRIFTATTKGIREPIGKPLTIPSAVDYFKVKKADDVILDLKSVVLLRNVPPTLTRDNKTHFKGEYGMIDNISGKFYND